MATIEMYSVNTNSDSTEGRGYPIPVAFFKSKDDARKVVRDERWARWCVMGYHNADQAEQCDISRQTINLYDSAESFWERHDEDNKRAKALTKLTDEEKKLLGLI